LGLIKQGDISELVVASKDRLARFGFELIEWLCTEYGTRIVVLDTQDTTEEAELGNDLMAIVQVYCCRWNGRRRYKVQDQSKETEVKSKQGAKTAAK
jgi:predicted site-specific integrase-resolvase